MAVNGVMGERFSVHRSRRGTWYIIATDTDGNRRICCACHDAEEAREVCWMLNADNPPQPVPDA